MEHWLGKKNSVFAWVGFWEAISLGEGQSDFQIESLGGPICG